MTSPLQQSKRALWLIQIQRTKWNLYDRFSLLNLLQGDKTQTCEAESFKRSDECPPLSSSTHSEYGVWGSLQQHVMRWDKVAECSPSLTFTKKEEEREEGIQCNTSSKPKWGGWTKPKKKKKIALRYEFIQKSGLETVKVRRLVAALRRDFLSCCERWSGTVRRLVTSVSHWPHRSRHKTLIAFLPSWAGWNTSYDTSSLSSPKWSLN